MTTVTISMPDSLKSFLESEVAEKGYGNTSEYIRELLRGAQKRAADERLEQALHKGLMSGPGRPADATFWNEMKEHAARIHSDITARRRAEK